MSSSPGSATAPGYSGKPNEPRPVWKVSSGSSIPRIEPAFDSISTRSPFERPFQSGPGPDEEMRSRCLWVAELLLQIWSHIP